MGQAQHEAWYIVSCPKSFTPSRATSYVTPLMSSTPSLGTCTPSFTSTRPTAISSDPLPGEIQPCADLRQLSVGSLAEPPTFAEPKVAPAPCKIKFCMDRGLSLLYNTSCTTFTLNTSSPHTLLHRHLRAQKLTRGQRAHTCPCIQAHAHRAATTARTHSTRTLCDILKLH